MRIAVLGAGFTGLTAALRLLQMGHQVTILEKESDIGGLAMGFSLPGWQWTLEKAYHHWFTNDNSALRLSSELGQEVIIKRPLTAVYINGKMLPFDSPLALLHFPYLSVLDRLRTGLATFYLKSTKNYHQFEQLKALGWLRKFMGSNSTDLIWDPLFTGKFGVFKEEIALSWFWARIYKRTPFLAYPAEGYKVFAQKIAEKITHLGGKILLDSEIINLRTTAKGLRPSLTWLQLEKKARTINSNTLSYDKVISTLPSPIFTKVTPQLPTSYVKSINSIPHLHAQNLILVSKKPFLNDIYWLNITDKTFPFLVVAQHTNFMDPKFYNNQHILYIGNYLPPDHPYLKMSVKQLLKLFDPYLQRLHPNYQLLTTNYQLFTAPFAQPVVKIGYPKLIPALLSPLKNIYVANLDMVYPWDRGTNYAIEMGEKIAELINEN